MYKIIGGDGKEYGPVTADQLRSWVREGRANSQTQVQPVGATNWQPLGTVPELADLFAAPPPPLTVLANADWKAQVLARDYRIEIGSCFSRGWELIKNDFWLLVGASFVASLITSGGGIPYLGVLIGLILRGPMMGGLYAMFLKRIRGQPALFGDAFAGFNLFLPLMLAHVVVGLLTGLGLILCILPGIYLAVSWIFTIPLVIERKMDFWEAMELSRQVVAKHWWLVFGFLTVCGLVAIAGVIACCVGIFVTWAIAEAAYLHAYEEIFGERPAPTA